MENNQHSALGPINRRKISLQEVEVVPDTPIILPPGSPLQPVSPPLTGAVPTPPSAICKLLVDFSVWVSSSMFYLHVFLSQIYVNIVKQKFKTNIKFNLSLTSLMSIGYGCLF